MGLAPEAQATRVLPKAPAVMESGHAGRRWLLVFPCSISHEPGPPPRMRRPGFMCGTGQHMPALMDQPACRNVSRCPLTTVVLLPELHAHCAKRFPCWVPMVAEPPPFSP